MINPKYLIGDIVGYEKGHLIQTRILKASCLDGRSWSYLLEDISPMVAEEDIIPLR